MASFWSTASSKRLIVCAVISAPLFLQASNDLDRRYSQSLQDAFLDGRDPDLKGWLPGAGGIFYTTRMDFFYDTFYANPQADWRFNVGFEPALMPADDLKTYRLIQWNPGATKAYQPWIAKMRAIDRLVLSSGVQPDLSQLEWHKTVGSFWIGRLAGQQPK